MNINKFEEIISGKMRSIRLLFTANDLTSGQLIIATWDSHYKILHFHHGGLDKLAQLLERWNIIKTKTLKDVRSLKLTPKNLSVEL